MTIGDLLEIAESGTSFERYPLCFSVTKLFHKKKGVHALKISLCYSCVNKNIILMQKIAGQRQRVEDLPLQGGYAHENSKIWLTFC